MVTINLGDEVKDSISGFRGIAVARHSYIQGCARISIQQPVKKDGSLPEAQTFDEVQLEVVKAAKKPKKIVRTDTGGPALYLPKGKPKSLR